MPRPNAILLVGPTGSGKSPLGDVLEKRGCCCSRRYVHFDFGRELRRIAAGDEPSDCLAPQDVDFLKSVLDTGALLEDGHFRIAEKVLRGFIERSGLAEDDFVLLNGLPRHIGQAESVDAIVDVQLVISLDCTPEVVYERIGLNTGGDRSGRPDDDAESVRKRLEVFAARTEPLIDHYRCLSVSIVTLEVEVRTTPDDIGRMLHGSVCVAPGNKNRSSERSKGLWLPSHA